jgi:hypothetical protein
MKLKSILCVCFVVLALAAPAEATVPGPPLVAAKAEFLGYSAGFRLQGTNGYEVGIYADSERRDGRGEIYVGVARKGDNGNGAYYRAPATVSEYFVKADLGSFGRIDLAIHPSGVERKIHIRCSKETYPFETGEYEGVVEFEGEGGYTRVDATRIPFQPPVTSFCGEGSGKGETRAAGLPGARLQGLSFAHGRRLSFQVNKNHPRRGRVPFSAELSERHQGIQIHRLVEGFAPADSFHFDPNLRSAELSLPSPFSGSATLRRRPNSVTPSWTGDLSLDFVGHPGARLAGPGVFVTLTHACFSYSGESGFAATC